MRERKELSPGALGQGWKADLVGQACSSETRIPQVHFSSKASPSSHMLGKWYR